MKKIVLAMALVVCMILGLMPAVSLQASAAGDADPYFVITQGPTSATGSYYVYEKTPGSDSFTTFTGVNVDTGQTYSELSDAITDITTAIGDDDATLMFGAAGTDSDNVTGTLAFSEEDGVRLGTSGIFTIKGSLCNSYDSTLTCTIRLEGSSAVVDGANIAAESSVNVIYNTSCGSLTINSGTISDPAGGSVGIKTDYNCTGDIIINGGEIDCGGEGIECNGNNTIDISGHDTVISGGNVGIQLFAGGSELTMEDGTVSGEIGILGENADVELSGGTVESPNSCALVVYRSDASISGATLTSANSITIPGMEMPGTVLVITDSGSGDANLYIREGSVTNSADTGYAVYSCRVGGSHTSYVHLSGTPSISGATADIWTDSVIYADDDSVASVSYSGDALTLEYDSNVISPDYTIAVDHTTNANENSFSLVNDGYYLNPSGSNLIICSYPASESFDPYIEDTFYPVPSDIGDWHFAIFDSNNSEVTNDYDGSEPYFYIWHRASGSNSLFVGGDDYGSEYLKVSAATGDEFKLDSFVIQNGGHYETDGYKIIGYRDGNVVPGAEQTVSATSGDTVTVTFAVPVWNDIDEFRIVPMLGADENPDLMFYFDDLTAEAPITDNTSPTISSFTPSDGETGVSISTGLTITFSENVSAVSGKNIDIKKASDSTTVQTTAVSDAAYVNVSGTAVTVTLPGSLEKGTDYYVTIDSGAFRDASGNAYAGLSDATAWNFTTVSSGSGGGGHGSSGSNSGSSSVDPNSAGEVRFTLQTVDDMAAKKRMLSVESRGVVYNIPAAAIDIASIAKALGASKLSDVTFSVTISPADSNDIAALNRSASVEGFEIIGSAMTFNATASYNGQSTVIHNFGSFVSRTVKIDSGVNPSMITTAITIDPDGKVRHIPTFVYQGSDGYYYADINSMTNSTYALIYNAAAFTDAKGKWYEAQADEMASRKILEGIAEGTFGGDKAITRAEFAAIVVRAFGFPEEKTGAYSDISDSAWYSGYVGAACRYGIVLGRSSTVFDPGANITREEAMAMIARGAKIAGCKGAEASIGNFSDMDKVSAWASDAVCFNLENGLIAGSDGMIRPRDTITRAETATVVLRLLQKAGLVDVRNNV